MNTLFIRTGKIGKLPQAIRQEVNQCIKDGDSARQRSPDSMVGGPPREQRISRSQCSHSFSHLNPTSDLTHFTEALPPLPPI
jgi:hypothetical protein